jgi:hypothetical protein
MQLENNKYARYRVGQKVILTRDFKSKKKHIEGEVFKVIEFANSLSMRDYKYLLRLDDGTEALVLERLILCENN